MFYFCTFIHGWHLAANTVLFQFRERRTQQSTSVINFPGHVQSALVGSVWQQGPWLVLLLLSLFPMTPEHYSSSHMSACLAFVLQRRDEIAATDICFVLKEGRASVLLSELSLVTGSFQKAPWILFQNQICTLFSVSTFCIKKRRGSMVLK